MPDNRKKPDLNIKPPKSYLDSLGDFAALLGGLSPNRTTPADAQSVDDAFYDALDAAKQLEREIDAATVRDKPVQTSDKPKTPPTVPDSALSDAQKKAIADEKPPRTLDEMLAELDSLVGLDDIKSSVRSLINLVKVRKLREEAGLPLTPMSLHMVFLGNPGTGKTTVARILGELFAAIGALPKGHLIETDRGGLVAGFVGQTAIKTTEVVNSALGGILFIDEAYSLTPERADNDFGREAIETLLKLMEDNRDKLVVIVAGYTGEMNRFIESNPGLQSRFARYFSFPDYNADELTAIFEGLCRKNAYALSDDARMFAAAMFDGMYKNRAANFGNARDVRNVFERAVAVHADRLAKMESPTKDELSRLLVVDLQKAEKAKH
ncbi:MAG: AAA family ATPase [Oscillospiraceae bacterium]|jgi:SpoVK/Ycf46/Vps4 family AAA+-type ATPase|nr:AAA family ATPase [Oscillospiraceae bacterium]